MYAFVRQEVWTVGAMIAAATESSSSMSEVVSVSMSEVVSVGHVARDEFAEGDWRMGGSVWYGAATMARLGWRVTVVTRIGDLELPRYAQAAAELGVTLHRLRTHATTTFAHSFRDGRRELRLLARARGIGAADLAPFRDRGAVYLGSVIGEHHDDLFASLWRPAVLAGQGELRGFDAHGVVTLREWRRAPVVLPHLRALVLSEEDLAGELAPARAWSRDAAVIVTRAERGSILLRDGRETAVAAYRPARIVDPTGAGDAFAAGLLVALEEGASEEEACDFANCVASFCLEGVGVSGLADRARVEERRRKGERLPF